MPHFQSSNKNYISRKGKQLLQNCGRTCPGWMNQHT